MSQFKAGDKVYVRTLKKNGTIIEARKKQTFLVAVGSVNIACSLSDLTSASSAKGAETRHAIKGSSQVQGKIPRVKDSIDLHGLTRAQAIETLEEYISSAVLADLTMVDIVHGIGSGVVKSAVHEVLSGLSCVKQFAVLSTNPGTTRAHLG